MNEYFNMYTQRQCNNMEDKITVQKEDILNAYKQASEEQKTLLENMFGKDMFQPQDIKERVKTFEDAVQELGEYHQDVKAYREWMRVGYAECKDINAYLKLRIICTALNEGWKPQFTEDEYRWYPLFTLWKEEELKDKSEEWKAGKRLWLFGGSSSNASYCGLAAANSNLAWTASDSYCSARLAVKSEELAEYFGKQFIDIWADYLFS